MEVWAAGRWAVPGSPRVHAVTGSPGPAEARRPAGPAWWLWCPLVLGAARGEEVWWQEDGVGGGCLGALALSTGTGTERKPGRGEGGMWSTMEHVSQRLSSWGELLVVHPKTSSSAASLGLAAWAPGPAGCPPACSLPSLVPACEVGSAAAAERIP